MVLAQPLCACQLGAHGLLGLSRVGDRLLFLILALLQLRERVGGLVQLLAQRGFVRMQIIGDGTELLHRRVAARVDPIEQRGSAGGVQYIRATPEQRVERRSLAFVGRDRA